MIYNDSGKIMNTEFLLMEFVNKETPLDNLLNEEYIFEDDDIVNLVKKGIGKIKDLPKLIKKAIEKLIELVQSAIKWVEDYIYRADGRKFILKNQEKIKQRLSELDNSEELNVPDYNEVNPEGEKTLGEYWRYVCYIFESPGYKNGKFMDTFETATADIKNYNTIDQVLIDLVPGQGANVLKEMNNRNISWYDLTKLENLNSVLSPIWFTNLSVYNNYTKEVSKYTQEIIDFTANFQSTIKPLKNANNNLMKTKRTIESITGNFGLVCVSILHNYFKLAIKHLKLLSSGCITLCMNALQTVA